MNYQRIYDDFIADRRAREAELVASGVYFERHHVVPRSMNGGDEAENLIALTAGDHFFAHLCLAKIHGGVMWATVWALCGMSNNGSRSRDRAWAIRSRRWVALARKANNTAWTGANNGRADLSVFEWWSVKTGECVIANRHESPVSARQVKDYLSPNRRWPVIFAGGEWYILGLRFASHEEARRNFEERNERNRDRQIGKRAGAKSPTSKPVRCIDTGIVYESVGIAAKILGLRQPKISQCCSGVRKTHGGCRWEYAS